MFICRCFNIGVITKSQPFKALCKFPVIKVTDLLRCFVFLFCPDCYRSTMTIASRNKIYLISYCSMISCQYISGNNPAICPMCNEPFAYGHAPPINICLILHTSFLFNFVVITLFLLLFIYNMFSGSLHFVLKKPSSLKNFFSGTRAFASCYHPKFTYISRYKPYQLLDEK